MVSSYTQNNGVEKPGIGEQSNTWGTTANLNYDILDRASNGVGTIALTGTSSNLTTLDGSLSDGQYKVLLLTGSLGATHTITILPNDVKKMYLVYNQTGQSVIFTQGSGGNVTIQNADSAIIYCTGIGATSAVINVADHLAMSSPRITGGSISGLSAPLAVVDGGTGGATQAAARTGLGLGTMATLNTGTAGSEFRTNTQNASTFQPLDTGLTSIAGLTTAADRMIYTTANDVYAVTTLSSFARTLLDDADASAMRTTLGSVIGTNVQAYNANLQSLAGVTLAQGDLLYATGANTLVRLPKGTAGQVLAMNSGATAPEWVVRSTKTMMGPVDTNVAAPFDFTIPAGTTRIRVCFDLMSMSSTGHWFIQLGTGGVPTTTGYQSGSGNRSLGVTTTSGFIVLSDVAARELSGTMDIEFSSVASNRWVSSHSIGTETTSSVSGGGRINLAGVCDFLRVTCSAANTPDGGRVTVITE